MRHLNEIGVSVVIVCYNARERIQTTLEHLTRQIDVNFAWELILVDNKSTDATASFVAEFWNEQCMDIPLRIITEHKRGTMYARETGIKAAQYRYLLFVDDDNWIEEKYLDTAFQIISQDESIAAVGGKGVMHIDGKDAVPSWISEYESSFACGAQGSKDGDTTFDKGRLYTAGAILDRQWLSRLYEAGFTSSLSGRTESVLVAGEDTELTYALKLIGGKLYYDSRLIFQHDIPAHRLQWTYQQKLWKAFGYGGYILLPYVMHFQQNKQLVFIKTCIRILLDFSIYGLLANLRAYEAGNKKVLLYQYAKGFLLAWLTRSKSFMHNRKQIKHLSKLQSIIEL